MEKIIFDNFKDVYEFRAAIQTRPNTGAASDHARTNWESFSGMSLDKAYQTLTDGIPEVVERLKKEVTRFQVSNASNMNQRRPVNYYNGHSPNVPAAIIGLPKSMRKVIKTPSKVKTITLFFDACVNCGVEAKDLEKAGFATYQLVYWLEKCGYRVKLYGVPVCTRSNGVSSEYGVCTVLLKDFRQPLDMLKLSFSLTSVSMWRRLGFRWIENAPGMSKGQWYAYGTLIGNDKRLELLKKCGFNMANAYYINYFTMKDAKFDPIKCADNLGIKTA